MTKKITLEDLATMVAGGFTEMGNQFAELKEEVRQNTESIERIDLRLQQVAYQSDYRELEGRVTTLEHKVRVR